MARTTQQASSQAGAQTGLAARRAALTVVEQALARRGGLETALAGPEISALDARERAFARALAMVVLRHKGTLDRMLSERVERAPPDAVRALLRLGAAQVLHLDVPAHAAVATTLDIAGADRATRPFKGLINAVLRGLVREAAPLLPPEVLAPDWLQARWRAAYGEADASATCALISEEPATDLTPKDPADAPALAEALEGEVLPGGQVRTRRKGDLAGWPGYAEGRWWVQDASAAIPARLLAVKPGQTGDRPVRRARGQGAAARRRRGGRHRAGPLRRAARTAQGEFRPHGPGGRDRRRPRRGLGRSAPVRRGAAGRPLHGHRHLPTPSGRAVGRPPLGHRLPRDRPGAAAERGGAAGEAGRAAGLLRLLAGAGGGRGPDRRLPRRASRLPPRSARAGRGRAPAASLTDAGTLRILPHQQAGGTDGFFIARLVRLPGEETKVKSRP